MRYSWLIVSMLSLCLVAPSMGGELYSPLEENHPESGLALGRIMIGDEAISVEIADTPKTQEHGLMNRLILPQNRGMLFLFEDVDYRSFWMKNTKIPLDIIYIREDGVVANIVKAEPCLADPCPSYPSRQPIKYVLELGKGEAKRLGISVGDSLINGD